MNFITIELIFGVAKNVNNVMSISSKIKEFLKLSESLKGKINKLINSELNAAIDLIKQAENSSEELQSFYLQNSIIHFNKAKHLEKGERLIFVYLGLASSQYFLKDISNTILTLKQFAALDAEDFITLDETLNDQKYISLLITDLGKIVKTEIKYTFLPHKKLTYLIETINNLCDFKQNKEIKCICEKIEELNKLNEKEISCSQLMAKIELREKLSILSRYTSGNMDELESSIYYRSKKSNFFNLQRKAIEIAEKLSQNTDILKLNMV